ncbi:phosphatase 2C-like domain-containing protein [Talaromyces proteolyticus]|uniref:Phosphatase 2C-like domain-containing protein n=1 Tax=Talaromyces proteolyticus TaxID=1131652 RepID=A0AAD4L3M1_9EURO|nr:phosphatase 2C-like domain-containing protein [Talaromyces proteolyticus]KAH8705322.1 phosphatase 2C-like domain-containing protein [Talaromyces proteolyticus]
MFGGSTSPPKEKTDLVSPTETSPTSLTVNTENIGVVREKRTPTSSGPLSRKHNEDQSAGERKRRSSSVNKAASFFNSAKNSFHFSSRESSHSQPQTPQTPLQRLGKMDPALIVPQGSFNNSAGESAPTSRSSFRVGVTEDRNRKCRRTMEDTHAYLYHFLGTPTPTSGAPPISSSQSSNVADKSTDEDEPTHVVETDNGYFAIFDGHAGTFAAEWCGKKLHLILEEIMRRYPNTPVPELLDQTFTSVDQQLEKLPLKNSGCTVVAAVLRWEDRVASSQSATGSVPIAPAATPSNKAETASNQSSESVQTPTQSGQPSSTSQVESALPKLQEPASRQRVLYTANVGDARIVLCRNGKALRLSYDHKGSDENEGKRIANAGGLILNNRVNGVLAVTRALGDTYLKDLVTGHPYTTETVIQPDQDEFLILACDGLWDVCTDQEAVDLIRNIKDAQEASKILVDHALSRFSTDNLSCMVVRFDANLIRDVVERRIEPIGVEGDPSSKGKRGVSEADKIVESAKKQLEDAEADDTVPVDIGLNAKLKDELVEQASNESPGPEVTQDKLVATLDAQETANAESDASK